MTRRLILILAVWLSPLAWGAPTTQPAPGSVLVFFQPARNIPMLAGLGINTFTGPEVENSASLPPAALAAGQAAWIQATIDNHAACILKNPPTVLPPNCVGVMMKLDEANGKGVLPATMMAESQDLRARYPQTLIYLSLAGDKVLSANFAKPAEAQLYRDYAALADVLTIDFYEKNRNADRYPDTYSGDCVKKLADLTGKPVIPWLEMNDQRLAPPPAGQGVNRGPTPAEIQAKFDWCIKQGAAGAGWFGTCDSGKYGWPASYWPTVDRTAASIQPQIDKVKAISLAYGKPLPPPPSPELVALRAQVAELDANLKITNARQDVTDAKLDAIADIIRRPTTRPTTQP